MPFGLKNAGATYQRTMPTIFHDMIHKFMEDYVDDIIAKSHSREEHLPILERIFVRLEQFKVRLNPKKCAFGLRSGRLLGYIVSAKGIEVDPTKVKEIMEMGAPQNISQMRYLQGRIQSIRRFISQLAEKCHYFTQLLHKDTVLKWDGKCEEAFTLLKKYLMNHPTLMPPIRDKPLIFYISATKHALGALLAQEDEAGKEKDIYYISITLVKYELNYTFIERACLAMVFDSQQLFHYMLSHKI